jgi:hypothetical protein
VDLPEEIAAKPVKLAGDQCLVHRYHRPPVLETEVHHVQPLGMGGPDVAANRIPVCPTGHANIHCYLRALARGKPLPKAARSERLYATRGYLAWDAAGRPGRMP